MVAPAPSSIQPAALKPPLKWAGGKRWLVPEIRKRWAGHEERRLVEPLCGGLAVSLGLSPPEALINDINPHTINFYRVLKHGLVIPAAFTMENDEALYYRHRDKFNCLVAERRAGGKSQRLKPPPSSTI